MLYMKLFICFTYTKNSHFSFFKSLFHLQNLKSKPKRVLILFQNNEILIYKYNTHQYIISHYVFPHVRDILS